MLGSWWDVTPPPMMQPAYPTVSSDSTTPPLSDAAREEIRRLFHEEAEKVLKEAREARPYLSGGLL